MAPPPPESVPLLEGRHRLLRLLGQGAFGSVQLAEDTELGREVAIKILKATTNPELAQRFRREAEVTARLEHPHIVRVYGYGFTPRREPYIAYELVQGGDLERYTSGAEEASLEARLRWSIQVARALEYAHGEGVIHRDLKPANVMVRTTGEALLCDFGLGRDTSSTKTALTEEGTLLGTPRYISREVVLGEPMGPGSDQFAWAACVYELFYLRPLRGQAKSLSELIGTLATSPDPEFRPAGEHPGLDAVLARALDPDPAARFASLGEFADALEEIEVEEATLRISRSGAFAPPEVAPGEPRVLGRATQVGLLVGCVSLGALLPLGESPPPAPAASRAPAPVAAPPASRVPVAEKVGSEVARFREALAAFAPHHMDANAQIRRVPDAERSAIFGAPAFEERVRAFLGSWGDLVEVLRREEVLAAPDGRSLGFGDADFRRDLQNAVIVGHWVLDGFLDFHNDVGKEMLRGTTGDLSLFPRLSEILQRLQDEGRDLLGRLSLLEGPFPDLVVAMRGMLRGRLLLGEIDPEVLEVHARMVAGPEGGAVFPLALARGALTRGTGDDLASCGVRRRILAELLEYVPGDPNLRGSYSMTRGIDARELMRACFRGLTPEDVVLQKRALGGLAGPNGLPRQAVAGEFVYFYRLLDDRLKDSQAGELHRDLHGYLEELLARPEIAPHVPKEGP